MPLQLTKSASSRWRNLKQVVPSWRTTFKFVDTDDANADDASAGAIAGARVKWYFSNGFLVLFLIFISARLSTGE